MTLSASQFIQLIFVMLWTQMFNSAPLPNSYTEQNPQIDSNFNQRPAKIIFSPDQNSMVYIPVENGTYFTFRSSLMQSQ